MKYKLNVKLILSYLFIAFFLVGMVAIVTNLVFEKVFKEYVMNVQQERNLNVVNLLSKDYKDKKTWTNVNFEEIGTTALENGLIVKVIDDNGIVLWDAMEHNSGICAEMLAQMAHNMKNYYPNFDGKYTDQEYNISVDNKIIGSALIGYYGPYYFNENDLVFLKTFNQLLVVIAIVAILISIGLGIIISKTITKNITNVISSAKNIVNGNYASRIDEKADTKEIAELINTVNNLAATLDHQQQWRKDLTSDIAHELRTPISTLQSHLEALKDGVWELTPDRIQDLHEEIIRLGKIVNGLDKLTDYDSNEIILNKNEFCIKQILAKIVNDFDEKAKEKNIAIKISGNESKIKADKDKIKQVFINIISNALKYTDKGGSIDVLVEELDTAIKVTINDNGIGISEEDLPYVFERFYRVDKSRTRATGGSGIGLSIVKNIVEAHNGNIQAISKLNQGTSIIVTLPR